jgi:xanthine dehydrogenase large subunit
VVRSPLARCEIRKIDFKTIAKIPGVAGVLTHKDIPGLNCVPIVIDDQPFLAERYVNYIGEPIAIVVAENRQTARLAAAQAKISIEELPPLLNPLEALNHPKIHLFGNDNIYKHIHIHRGDVKKAFAIAM